MGLGGDLFASSGLLPATSRLLAWCLDHYDTDSDGSYLGSRRHESKSQVLRRAAQLRCPEYQHPAPYLEEQQRTEAHSPLGLMYTVDKLSFDNFVDTMWSRGLNECVYTGTTEMSLSC
jgi:hypothetical protein